MKNRNYLGNTICSTFSVFVPTNTVLEDSTQSLVGYYERVAKLPSNNGNFKDPTGFQYNTNVDKWASGVIHKKSGFGAIVTSITGNLTQVMTPPTLDEPPWDSYFVQVKALEALNEKVRGSTDLSVDFAEAGKTRDMVTSMARYLNGGLRFKDFHPAAMPKNLANAWLSWTYGWKPLANSFYGSAMAAANLANRRLTFKGRHTRFDTHRDLKIPLYLDGRFVKNLSLDGGSFSKHGFEYVITLEPLNWVQYLSSFTSLNPVSIAWELIPYSFVVDWFYNIGGSLRNLETALLFARSFKSGYTTELKVFDGAIAENSDFKPYSFEYNYDVRVSKRFRAFTRTRLSSYPLPNFPRLQVDLGASRLISAAALLMQKLR